jgi:hypothetical protein
MRRTRLDYGPVFSSAHLLCAFASLCEYSLSARVHPFGLPKPKFACSLLCMTTTFFGTNDDISGLWRGLFEIPEMHIFEEYSLPDAPNRWFESWTDICDYLDSGGRSLGAWSSHVGGRPIEEKVTFNESTQRKFGKQGRTILRSPAIIRVGRNSDQNGCLAAASIACWTEKGARQRSVFSEELLNEIDWKQLRSIIGRIERGIQKSSPAKIRSYPIMPDAWRRTKSGEISLWNWGEPCTYPSPLITLKSDQ